MYNTNDYWKLLSCIENESVLGRNVLNFLYPLDDGICRELAKLGYCVITTIYEQMEDFLSHTQISWIQPKEKGVYVFKNLGENTKFCEELIIEKDSEGIKSNEARDIAFEVQKQLLKNNYKSGNVVYFSFVIFPELREIYEKCFDITAVLSSGRTFFLVKNRNV